MRHLLLYLLFVPAAVVPATGQTAETRLTLDQAVANVLEHSPVLKAAGYESGAAAARIRAARLTPAIAASIEFENFGGSGSLSGTDSLESTLSLSKVLELGDKARLRGEVAQSEALVLHNEQDAERLDLLAETAKRFIRVVTDQAILQIAGESLALAQETHEVVEKRVNAGKSANAELRRAKIAQARMQLEFDHARHALDTSRLKLVSLWGATAPSFETAEAELFAMSDPLSFASLVERLDNNPDLVRLATEKRLAETRGQLARSHKKANVEIAGGVRHFNSLDDTGLVVSLAIPFGNRSRAAPKIDEADMLGLRNPFDLEQRRMELHTALFEVHQEIRHEMDAVTTLHETIIPLAEQALRDYEQGYRAGRYSLLELNVAQRTLLDSRLELVTAAANYHRYRIEIDRLTGAGLKTGVSR